jgi:hypothetical protein
MLTAFLIGIQRWVSFLDKFPWLTSLPFWSAHWSLHLPKPPTSFIFREKPGLGLLSLFLSEVKPTRTLLVYVGLHMDFLPQKHILSKRYTLAGIAVCFSARWDLCYESAKWKTGI